MSNGPGKYDDALTKAREEAEAEGAILIVFNGKNGNGFSVQASQDHIERMPAILEEIASQIRASSQH